MGESASDYARSQREKEQRLARAAELNERGALGERETTRALKGLPDGWTVLRDLTWPDRAYDNVDHIVIGPPGVFVIDSKTWTGQVTLSDNVLRKNRYREDRSVGRTAEAARAVAALASVVPPNQVHPVLCFFGESNVMGWASDVMVCSTANVVEALKSRRPALTPAEMRAAAHQLTDELGVDPDARPGRISIEISPIARRAEPVDVRGRHARRGPGRRAPVRAGVLPDGLHGVAQLLAGDTGPA